jgi:hypothetical protein
MKKDFKPSHLQDRLDLDYHTLPSALLVAIFKAFCSDMDYKDRPGAALVNGMILSSAEVSR